MTDKHFLKPCPVCNISQVNHERTINDIELLKCSACNFVYANLENQHIIEANSSYDKTSIASYEKNQTAIDNVWFENIVKKLTALIGGRGKVLDVGCGNGLLLKHFIDDQWTAYGMDLSPWAKKYAQIYGYKLYSAALESSNLPSNYFDVVTSTSTLEHIPQPYQHVQEIMRVLKPGGIAYFAGIPNYGSLSIRVNISTFECNDPPGHVNYFTAKSIHRLFSHPDIANIIKEISIYSYGIPEVHRISRSINKSIQKIKRKPIDISNGSNIANTIPESKQNPKPSYQKALLGILLSIYYNLGKLFHLGDKLTVIAIKR